MRQTRSARCASARIVVDRTITSAPRTCASFLDRSARRVFRDAVGLDDAAWARGHGWVLWRSLVMLAGSAGPGDRAGHRAVLAAALADPVT